ncbi:MAG: LytR C-terminal domain-containing protein [Propionibacteriaceae bacterium]|nr:LytR C-terminal domain-containing protein [Propionibacteriaceae bacterium]
MQRIDMRLILTPVTLIALCGFLAFGAWWGYQQISAPLPGKLPTPCVSTSVTELSSSQVVVRVLNGGYTTGLGTKVSKELSGYGFIISGTGNTQERVKKTIIVAGSETAPEAQLVLGFFKEATIRVDKDRAIDAHVDVLVGSEYAGTNPEAPKAIAVSGQVCIAVPPAGANTATPNPTPSG